MKKWRNVRLAEADVPARLKHCVGSTRHESPNETRPFACVWECTYTFWLKLPQLQVKSFLLQADCLDPFEIKQ